MKEYIVSLDFLTSTSVTALQLSELIGIEETALTSRPSQRIEDGIYWRFEPSADDKADLAAGIELVNTNVHPQRPIREDENIKDIYISIGVIHDLAVCGEYLSFPSLALLTAKFPDLGITIITYPVDDWDDEDDPSGFMRWYHRNRKEKGAPPHEIERDCVNEYYEKWLDMGKPGAASKGSSNKGNHEGNGSGK